MLLKKSIVLFATVAIVLNVLPTSIFAQKKRVVQPKSAKTSSYKKNLKRKIIPKKIISLGVVNGRVINLVRPDYPKSAISVGARGTVAVEVLINERGEVIRAKALSGNPLLIANSIKAAKLSKFEPFVLENGEAQKVSGIILYNYFLDRLNWLEIGYCFEIPNYIYSERLENYLPLGFDQEKQLLAQLKPMPLAERNEILQTVSSLIENKLNADYKKLWLFALGKELGKLSNSYWNDKNETLNKIQILLYTTPEGVSPILIKSLEKLISTFKNNPNQFYNNLTSLIERLYGFGVIGQ